MKKIKKIKIKVNGKIKRIVDKLTSLRFVGYELVHLSKIIFLEPFFLKVLIASLISKILAIPVDKITGFFVKATFVISGISVISKEEILLQKIPKSTIPPIPGMKFTNKIIYFLYLKCLIY